MLRILLSIVYTIFAYVLVLYFIHPTSGISGALLFGVFGSVLATTPYFVMGWSVSSLFLEGYKKWASTLFLAVVFTFLINISSLYSYFSNYFYNHTPTIAINRKVEISSGEKFSAYVQNIGFTDLKEFPISSRLAIAGGDTGTGYWFWMAQPYYQQNIFADAMFRGNPKKYKALSKISNDPNLSIKLDGPHVSYTDNTYTFYLSKDGEDFASIVIPNISFERYSFVDQGRDSIKYNFLPYSTRIFLDKNYLSVILNSFLLSSANISYKLTSALDDSLVEVLNIQE